MSYRYIDVHTHVNLDAFEGDFLKVTANTLQEGVAHINVGTGKMTSLRAVEMAALAPEGLFAAVGLHPVRAGGSHDNDGSEPELFDRAYYEELAQDPKVVAIGECGLDYFRVERDTKAKQERAFIEQIELANDVEKPLMLHIRDVKNSMSAYEDALAILKTHAKVLGNVHFFAGTYEIAKLFWDIGYTTSFTGVITFADQYDETIKNAPIEMLHAETDAPYVSPIPFRGTRNEPLYVREVYKRIAELRGEDEETVRIQLLRNAETMFRIELQSLAS